MAVDIIVPEVGEVGMEVTFVAWLKNEGDHVEEGELLFQLDTQKTMLDVESVGSGTLSGIQARPGDLVAPKQVIARLAAPGETLDLASTTSATAVDAAETTGAATTTAASASAVAVDTVTGGISPRARRLAKQLAVTLDGVRGSGPGGIVTESDVRAAVASPDAQLDADAERRERTRQAVARMTSDSWQRIPHFYLSVDAEVTAGLEVTRPTTLVCAAIARAIREHPECNLEWAGDAPVRRGSVDLGILVDTPAGLILPAVRGADLLTIADLTAAIAAAAERARIGTLRADDFGARSLSVSNLGMHAVDRFGGVIATPDPLLLTVGRTRVEPRREGDGWRPATIVTLTLSVDHRALDGAAAARLLTTLEGLLGDPSWLSAGVDRP